MPAHNFLLVNGSFYVKAAKITVETNIVLIRWKMAGYTDREEGSKKKSFFLPGHFTEIRPIYDGAYGCSARGYSEFEKEG